MPLDQLALEFLFAELTDHGYSADEVCTAIARLSDVGTLQRVRLKTDAILGETNSPIARIGIYGVETDLRYFPKGVTNSLDHAGERDETAKRYLGHLSQRTGYRFERSGGTMVSAYGNPETNGRIFAVKGELILPSSKPMHVNISIGRA